MKVFLAAGHGRADPGAVFRKLKERDEAIKVVNGVTKLVRLNSIRSVEYVLVPHKYDLDDSVEWINGNITNLKKDFCLELHFNSNKGFPGAGTEVLYGNLALSRCIQMELVRILRLKDRGIKDGHRFWFNRGTKIKSAIVEIGFINNPNDVRVIRAGGDVALLSAIKYAIKSL